MSSARNHAKRSRYSYKAIPFAGLRRNAFVRNSEREQKKGGFFARLLARRNRSKTEE